MVWGGIELLVRLILGKWILVGVCLVWIVVGWVVRGVEVVEGWYVVNGGVNRLVLSKWICGGAGCVGWCILVE